MNEGMINMTLYETILQGETKTYLANETYINTIYLYDSGNHLNVEGTVMIVLWDEFGAMEFRSEMNSQDHFIFSTVNN